jgi:hypothetical protein
MSRLSFSRLCCSGCWQVNEREKKYERFCGSQKSSYYGEKFVTICVSESNNFFFVSRKEKPKNACFSLEFIFCVHTAQKKVIIVTSNKIPEK